MSSAAEKRKRHRREQREARRQSATAAASNQAAAGSGDRSDIRGRLSSLFGMMMGAASEEEEDPLYASKQTLLSVHAQVLRSISEFVSQPGRAVIQSSSSVSVKPRSTSRVSLAQLLPIGVKQLHLETTHRGRVLRGRLIVDAATQVGVGTLLEDEQGDVCRLSVYGFASVTAAGSLAGANLAGRRLLPKGARVAIIEPYFKRLADGFTGVRVDDPNDVVLVPDESDVLPAQQSQAAGTVHAWESLKQAGNAFFEVGHFEEAATAFTRGLQTDDGLLLALLGNLAQCHIDLSSPRQALRYALAALAVDSASSKSWYRSAVALRSLEQPAAAKWFAEEAAKVATEATLVASARTLATQIAAPHATHSSERIASGEEGRVPAIKAAIRILLHDSRGAGSDAADVTIAEGEAASAKERGNSLYKQGDKSGASSVYLAALHALAPRAVLLSNRALCHLKLPSRTLSALIDSTAALTLDPTLVKAAHRQAESLLACDCFEEAAMACASGLQLAADDATRTAFKQMQKRIATATPSSATVTASEDVSSLHAPYISRDGTWGTVNERTDFLERSKEELSGAQQAVANEMMLMIQRMSAASGKSMPRVIDERIPTFHTDFARAGRWPIGVNVPQCREKLHEAYEVARATPMHDVTLRQDESFEILFTSYVTKRLGIREPGSLRWLLEAPGQDVRFAREHLPELTQIGYQAGFHSFSNEFSRAEMMTQGTVHVAVGFVDLGQLRTAQLNGDAKRPLRWIGYDQSAPCVAKTMIIARMLQQTPASATILDDVLEVWYSATWRPTALAAFRRALTQLLEQQHADTPDAQEVRKPEVLRLMQHWQKAVVPLATARAKWMECAESPIDAGNFLLAVDRAAFCAYALTGDVLPARPDSVGSVTMFAVPDGMERSIHESIFSVTPLRDLLKCRADDANKDIVSSAAAYLRDGIRRISQHLLSGRITIECRLGTIGVDSPLCGTIRALHPHTMSWSNVLDYFKPRDFHAVARACSAPSDTVHFAYSMNWVTQVKGACIIDYPHAEARAALLDHSAIAYKNLLRTDAVFPGASRLLLCPPAMNAMNTSGYCLALSHYHAWLRAFFDPSRAGPHQLGLVEPPVANFLARQSTSLALTFTYDMEIRFQSANGTADLAQWKEIMMGARKHDRS